MTSPHSSSTGICVCGRGNPAWISNSRSQVSLGDCAPPSTKSTAIRACRIPRLAGYRCTSNSISATFRSVACRSASIAATASLVGYQHPKSSAVRAGVVTGIPLIGATSSSSMRSPRTSRPGSGFRLVCRISSGAAMSPHRAPCTAAAAHPAMMPRRRDHSHPARARTSGVISVPRLTYTSRNNLVYRVRRALLVTSPLATASLPMNGSAMSAAFHAPMPASRQCGDTIHRATPA